MSDFFCHIQQVRYSFRIKTVIKGCVAFLGHEIRYAIRVEIYAALLVH